MASQLIFLAANHTTTVAATTDAALISPLIAQLIAVVYAVAIFAGGAYGYAAKKS